MAISANAFIDVAFFNSMSGLSLDADDAQMEILINSVTSILEDICNRPLKARDFSYDSEDDGYSEEYAIFDPPPKNISWFPTLAC